VSIRGQRVLTLFLTLPTTTIDVHSPRLAGRSISSTIPNALDLLTGLRMLDLSNNKFWGRLPTLANTLNLTDLNVANNTLDGGLASEMYSLQSLINVVLYGNALTGQVPPWLDQWTSLKVLDLSSNKFIGPIPSSLGTLSRLERLDLSSNQLTGTLPPLLFQLTNLQALNLDRNSIAGSIPTDILLLTRLRQLDLSFNKMTGTVPTLLFGMVPPETLALEGNNFTSASTAAPNIVNMTV
jgi:Leucine-rich repeat (LRR) protein